MVSGISNLISKNAIRDRYNLHKKRMFKRDRSILELGSIPTPPLRPLYLEFKDETIYSIVESFFSSAKYNLWVNSETILRKTIGIQALFDILNIILKSLNSVGKIILDKEYFDQILLKVNVEEIDAIGRNYSGSGRVAIRNKLREQINI